MRLTPYNKRGSTLIFSFESNQGGKMSEKEKLMCWIALANSQLALYVIKVIAQALWILVFGYPLPT